MTLEIKKHLSSLYHANHPNRDGSGKHASRNLSRTFYLKLSYKGLQNSMYRGLVGQSTPSKTIAESLQSFLDLPSNDQSDSASRVQTGVGSWRHMQTLTMVECQKCQKWKHTDAMLLCRQKPVEALGIIINIFQVTPIKGTVNEPSFSTISTLSQVKMSNKLSEVYITHN